MPPPHQRHTFQAPEARAARRCGAIQTRTSNLQTLPTPVRAAGPRLDALRGTARGCKACALHCTVNVQAPPTLSQDRQDTRYSTVQYALQCSTHHSAVRITAQYALQCSNALCGTALCQRYRVILRVCVCVCSGVCIECYALGVYCRGGCPGARTNTRTRTRRHRHRHTRREYRVCNHFTQNYR